MSLTVTIKMNKQPYPPCKYCIRECKDENVSRCSEYASKKVLQSRRF